MGSRMIRTVIVDDDALALTMLKMLIQVEHIRIVKEFTKADEAAEYIKNHPVELLITDMRMPRVDGLELIQLAKEYQPKIEIITISSYKDFHYVKESLKEGSIDYILKHTLNEEILTQALMEASKRIFAAQKEKFNEEEIYTESQDALKEKVFNQLFRNEISPKEVEDTLKRHHIALQMQSSVLLLCEVDEYLEMEDRFRGDDKRIFLQTVRGIIEKVVEKVPEKVVVSMRDGRFALLLSFTGVKSQLYIYSKCNEYGKRLNENVNKILGIQLSISMGTLCISLDKLKASFEQCQKMLENKFTQGKGQIYNEYRSAKRIETVSNTADTVIFHGEEIYKKLIQCETNYVQDIEELFSYYKKMKLPKNIVELNIVEILNIGNRVIMEKQLEKIKQEYGFQTLYHKIKRTDTVEEILKILLDFYARIVEENRHISDLGKKSYSKYTIKTIRYMETHYHEIISQQDVAEIVGVHSAYLSKTFKKDTGFGFTEYLNRIRIDRAKSLIQNGELKLKEIYLMVGFNQYNYFLKVFKQLEGCTPAEYENRLN